MDLRLLDAEPTEAERAAIDAVVGEQAVERRARRPAPTAPPAPAAARRCAPRSGASAG